MNLNLLWKKALSLDKAMLVDIHTNPYDLFDVISSLKQTHQKKPAS
jgi:hypothetical protein